MTDVKTKKFGKRSHPILGKGGRSSESFFPSAPMHMAPPGPHQSIDMFQHTQNNHEQLLGSLQIQIASLQNESADTKAAWHNAVEQSNEVSKLGVELSSLKKQIKQLSGHLDLLRQQQEEFQTHQSKELVRIKDILIDLIHKGNINSKSGLFDSVTSNKPEQEKSDLFSNRGLHTFSARSHAEDNEQKDELSKQLTRHNSDKIRQKKKDREKGIDIPSRKGSKKDVRFMSVSAPSSLTTTFDIPDAFASETYDVKAHTTKLETNANKNIAAKPDNRTIPKGISSTVGIYEHNADELLNGVALGYGIPSEGFARAGVTRGDEISLPKATPAQASPGIPLPKATPAQASPGIPSEGFARSGVAVGNGIPTPHELAVKARNFHEAKRAERDRVGSGSGFGASSTQATRPANTAVSRTASNNRLLSSDPLDMPQNTNYFLLPP